MVVRISFGRPLLDHQIIVFILDIPENACMQASALLSHLFNDREQGLRKLFAFFGPHLHSDEYDIQVNFLFSMWLMGWWAEISVA